VKICHVVYAYYPQDMRPRQEAESFQSMGHELHVIAMRDKGERGHETIQGVQVHRFPFSVERGNRNRYIFQYGMFLIGATAMLLLLHLRRRFDVIHVHSLPDFQVFSAILEKLSGARIVLDLHEAMPELLAARFHLSMDSLLVSTVKAVELVSCLFADHVIVVNETMQERLIAKGIPIRKISVVVNSPPLESLTATGLEQKALELGLAGFRPIVYVGGLNQERDLETLIRAIAALPSELRVKLIMIGHGDSKYRDHLLTVAADLGLDEVKILKRVPHTEAFSYMSLSEVGPVTYEANPLTQLAMSSKALEYVAAGKPLVISDLEASRRTFGDAALYYHAGDPNDLARQLSRLLDEPDVVGNLTTLAKSVLEGSSWKVMVRRLAEVYHRPKERFASGVSG
jgi:glycosyltransferase involved in cell wall biosynthesis